MTSLEPATLIASGPVSNYLRRLKQQADQIGVGNRLLSTARGRRKVKALSSGLTVKNMSSLLALSLATCVAIILVVVTFLITRSIYQKRAAAANASATREGVQLGKRLSGLATVKELEKERNLHARPEMTFGRKKRNRTSDPRYVDGQKILVEAMKYLAKADPVANRSAIELLSEHVRTRFRMSDSPLN